MTPFSEWKLTASWKPSIGDECHTRSYSLAVGHREYGGLSRGSGFRRTTNIRISWFLSPRRPPPSILAARAGNQLARDAEVKCDAKNSPVHHAHPLPCQKGWANSTADDKQAAPSNLACDDTRGSSTTCHVIPREESRPQTSAVNELTQSHRLGRRLPRDRPVAGR